MSRKPLTTAQLDALAVVTADDVAHAREMFHRDAPPPYRKLLDAKPAPEKPPRKGRNPATVSDELLDAALDDE